MYRNRVRTYARVAVDTMKMMMKIPKKDGLGVMSMDAGAGIITGAQAISISLIEGLDGSLQLAKRRMTNNCSLTHISNTVLYSLHELTRHI